MKGKFVLMTLIFSSCAIAETFYEQHFLFEMVYDSLLQ